MVPRTGDQSRSALTLGPDTEARRSSARSSLIQPAETSPENFSPRSSSRPARAPLRVAARSKPLLSTSRS